MVRDFISVCLVIDRFPLPMFQPVQVLDNSLQENRRFMGVRNILVRHFRLVISSFSSKDKILRPSTLRLTFELLIRFSTVFYQYHEGNDVQMPSFLYTRQYFIRYIATCQDTATEVIEGYFIPFSVH